ncbi:MULTISPECIES: MBL fold metallo-hydrolase [Mycobacterium]|uniref:MBL fold metallo-hydrolase n=1 Tax=Mycobacterium kiyosense TaxID=2871094 RepID=A0A9P3Q289_9MYCO|nr:MULTISPECIES: MBL fold metallo-hydrolase [Mycobacterium]BDB42468.1 MBL fold metallo-hydrolase [Mycobacterium kiyosense]BDE14269.1 MBL fold metallo-hydrolase [Mycobacterium sp. 20KCMC460]GLB81515.1 MBL fold metallo-hydrolase [Mycobacterium kiyosense]GLB90112.1 MBL fold metallo-hydrolase [Mycobacterium kiyosense]GLB93708.1 MBL fold metallo-hydrolase [Mycobacterium kiyosense]
MHYEWEALSGTVQRCRLPFCDVTVGLVRGHTGSLLVDTGSTLDEATMVNADIGELGGQPVTDVVLTHHHFDHVLGSPVFADAEIHCAPGVIRYLSTGTAQLRADAVDHGADVTQIDRAILALRAPRYGIRHSAVDLGDRAISIAYLGAGHTRSDLVVLVPARDGENAVVFTGDLVEESGDPALDADSDLAAWPETLDRLLAIGGPDAVYVPGHGSVVDAAFIRRQQDWLRAAAADLSR